MKLKRFLAPGLALLAITVVALLVFSSSTKYSRRSQRLPDGSTLKIVSISYGTNHSFAMPHRKPWESFLVKHIPRTWTARLGWETTGGQIGLSPPPGERSLVIFTLCELAKSDSFSSSGRVALCNEQGAVYDSAIEGAVLGGYRGKHRWRVVGWQFSKLPRDAKFLRLEFSEQSADANTPVAEFFIPNPLLITHRRTN